MPCNMYRNISTNGDCHSNEVNVNTTWHHYSNASHNRKEKTTYIYYNLSLKKMAIKGSYHGYNYSYPNNMNKYK